MTVESFVITVKGMPPQESAVEYNIIFLRMR